MSEDPSKGAPKKSLVGDAEGPEGDSLEKQWIALMRDTNRWYKEAKYAVAKLYLGKTLKIVEGLYNIKDATGGGVHHVFIDIVVVLEVVLIQRAPDARARPLSTRDP